MNRTEEPKDTMISKWGISAGLAATPSVRTFGITATRRIAAFDHAIEYRRRTADATLHGYSPRFAVHGTRPAFHARVTVDDHGTFVFDGKNLVRADMQAHPAAVAFGAVQFQGRNLRQISKSRHSLIPFSKRITRQSRESFPPPRRQSATGRRRAFLSARPIATYMSTTR